MLTAIVSPPFVCLYLQDKELLLAKCLAAISRKTEVTVSNHSCRGWVCARLVLVNWSFDTLTPNVLEPRWCQVGAVDKYI